MPANHAPPQAAQDTDSHLEVSAAKAGFTLAQLRQFEPQVKVNNLLAGGNVSLYWSGAAGVMPDCFRSDMERPGMAACRRGRARRESTS